LSKIIEYSKPEYIDKETIKRVINLLNEKIKKFGDSKKYSISIF
jgi:uncharacterized Fe-S cluster-containing MiaB family protein